MKFKGRLGIVILITAILLLAGTVFTASQYKAFGGLGGYLTMVIILGVATALTFSFIFRNYLTVSDETITVCFGFTTSKIPIDSVTSMKKTKSVIASSSASMKRIEMTYTDKNCGHVIFLSPKEEDAFIQKVRTYNSNINM